MYYNIIISAKRKEEINMEVTRKNYSFYVPDDFDKLLDDIKASDRVMTGMSKSQSLYYIVSKLASLNIDIEKLGEIAAAQNK